MNIFQVLVFVLFTCSLNAQVNNADLLGEWKMVTKTPIGDRKQTFTFQFQNDQLIGITKNGNVEIIIQGNQLSWKNTVKTPIGTIDIRVEGLYGTDGQIEGFSSPISGRMKGKKLSWVMSKKL